MHAVGVAGIVLEDNLDRVAHLGVHHRADQTQVLLLGRARLEDVRKVSSVYSR